MRPLLLALLCLLVQGATPGGTGARRTQQPPRSSNAQTAQPRPEQPAAALHAALGGLAVGARVKRGPDWRYNNQDGGAGNLGTVLELSRWRGNRTDLLAARVRWDYDGSMNVYRWSISSGGVASDGRKFPPGPTVPDDSGTSSGSGGGEGGAASAGTATTTTGPPIRDLEVVRDPNDPATARGGAADPSYDEGRRAEDEAFLAAHYEKQLASAKAKYAPHGTRARLLALYTALGGPRWVSRRGWETAAGVQAKVNAMLTARRHRHAAAARQRRHGAGSDADDEVASDAELSALAATMPDPCVDGWEGVSCRDGAVVGLDLSGNGLAGTLPADAFAGLGGTLVSLSLGGNGGISGALPESLCKLASLSFLDLHGNGFSGRIPACLGSALTQLQVLDLHANKLGGLVPGSLLTAAPALRVLHLHGNADLTGFEGVSGGEVGGGWGGHGWDVPADTLARFTAITFPVPTMTQSRQAAAVPEDGAASAPSGAGSASHAGDHSSAEQQQQQQVAPPRPPRARVKPIRSNLEAAAPHGKPAGAGTGGGRGTRDLPGHAAFVSLGGKRVQGAFGRSLVGPDPDPKAPGAGVGDSGSGSGASRQQRLSLGDAAAADAASSSEWNAKPVPLPPGRRYGEPEPEVKRGEAGDDEL